MPNNIITVLNISHLQLTAPNYNTSHHITISVTLTHSSHQVSGKAKTNNGGKVSLERKDMRNDASKRGKIGL